MADILARAGETVPLVLVLADGNATKYPQARVFDRLGTPVPLATIDLTYVAYGHYFGTYVVPSATKFNVVYIVYSDVAHTTIDDTYSFSQDTISADVPESPATILSNLAEAQLNIAYEDASLTFRALAWIDRAGQTVTTPTSCTITVRNRANAVLYTNTTLVHFSGVFAFQTSPLSLDDNDVGYVVVTVSDTLGSATTDQSFTTVT